MSVLLVAALLSGCQSAIYGQLDERQVNEMTSALEDGGIAVSRTQNKDGTYALLVDESKIADSLTLLAQRGFPRQSYQGVGQVFTGDKLVSTTFEEKARFVYALEQELADSLTRIAGVTNARVHITVPAPLPLSDKPLPSRAAVFVYYSSGLDLVPKIPVIKSLVVNSVENLSYDDVTVALFPAEGTLAAAPPGAVEPASVPVRSLPIIPIVIIGGLGLALLASGWRGRAKPAAPPDEQVQGAVSR